MGKKIEIADPKSGEVNPWHMLGTLQAVLEHGGSINKTDWNRAVAASVAFESRHPSR